VSAGWFALGGVVIGGLLNGFVSWMLARAAASKSARAAALLITEELMHSLGAFVSVDERQTWGAFLDSPEFGKRTEWEANRATRANGLPPDGYMNLAAAYNGLFGAAVRASNEPPDKRINPIQNQALKTTVLALNRGLTYLTKLIHRPPRWKFVARWKFNRKSDAHIAKLMAEDKSLERLLGPHFEVPSTGREAIRCSPGSCGRRRAVGRQFTPSGATLP
jgi:hypothetical protein